MKTKKHNVGSLENQTHPIAETKISENTFIKQAEVEKRIDVPGMDWKIAFQELLSDVLKFAHDEGWPQKMIDISQEEVERRTTEFIERLNEIEMSDTIYHDVPEAIPKLLRQSGEVDLWTFGDVINENQKRKVESSSISRLIDEAKKEYEKDGSDVTTREIISADKIGDIPDILSKFWRSKNRPSKILVSIYEDSISNLEKAEPEINKWAEANGVDVKKLYIRAKTGHKANEEAPPGLDFPMESVTKLSDAVSVFARDAESVKIPREHRLILLDFDGALSDSRIARLRIAHVTYLAIMKTLKELVQAGVDWQDKGDKENKRAHIKNFYLQIQGLWKEDLKKNKK